VFFLSTIFTSCLNPFPTTVPAALGALRIKFLNYGPHPQDRNCSRNIADAVATVVENLKETGVS
jgi:hypothetical protein